MDKPVDDLSECHEVVEQLQEEKKELQAENEQLRESADTFGGLAERLSHALAQRESDSPSKRLVEAAERRS